ncbi:hypothetical protein ACHMW9_20875 [Mesorhizobium terrae]
MATIVRVQHHRQGDMPRARQREDHSLDDIAVGAAPAFGAMRHLLPFGIGWQNIVQIGRMDRDRANWRADQHLLQSFGNR